MPFSSPASTAPRLRSMPSERLKTFLLRSREARQPPRGRCRRFRAGIRALLPRTSWSSTSSRVLSPWRNPVCWTAHVDAVVLGDTPNVTPFTSRSPHGHGTEDLRCGKIHPQWRLLHDHAEAAISHSSEPPAARPPRGFHRDSGRCLCKLLSLRPWPRSGRRVVSSYEVDRCSCRPAGCRPAWLAVGEVTGPCRASPQSRKAPWAVLVHPRADSPLRAFAQQAAFRRSPLRRSSGRGVVEEDSFRSPTLSRQRSVAGLG